MKLVFRCDATAATGLGHLSRSLALAEALRRQGGEAVFLGNWGDAAFALLSASGFAFHGAIVPSGSVEDAADTVRLVACESAEGVLADSYALDTAWVSRLRTRGVAVALIDDFARLSDYSSCAGVLNFTVGAGGLDYPGLPVSRRALGPAYFPVRENLQRLRAQRRVRDIARPQRVLIVLGGGDRLGMTVSLYHTLRRSDHRLQVRAIVADGPAQASALKLNPDDFPSPAGDLAVHYAWAHACVTGGGLAKYECAYLGLPMAIVSQTPEQQAETELFCAAGLGWDLTPHGRTDAWELRLQTFLRNPAPASAARVDFPPDSADHAIMALQHFVAAAVAPPTLPLSA